MTQVYKADEYFQANLDPAVITELSEKGVDIVSFQRYLKKREVLLKSGEKLDLIAVQKDYSALQKSTAKKAAAFNQVAKNKLPSARSVKVIADNLLALDARLKAQQARFKATSYSGKKPESTAENTAIKQMLQSELNQITLGMQPADYAQKTIGEFIVQLEVLATGRAAAVAEVKKLARAFEVNAIDLSTNKIDTSTYVAQCKSDFEKSVITLSQPHTIAENARHVLLNTIRTILNAFDNLYTWLISAETTSAKTKGHLFFIPAPKTALATKITDINKELVVLEKEVALSESQDADKAQKTAKRAALTKQVETGDAPEGIQQKIEAAQEKQQQRAFERGQERAHKKEVRKTTRDLLIEKNEKNNLARFSMMFDKLVEQDKSNDPSELNSEVNDYSSTGSNFSAR